MGCLRTSRRFPKSLILFTQNRFERNWVREYGKTQHLSFDGHEACAWGHALAPEEKEPGQFYKSSFVAVSYLHERAEKSPYMARLNRMVFYNL